MADMNEIVKLAIDAHRGCVEKYSNSQAMEVLRKAAIEANNGSTKLDYRAIRDGKCPGLFSLIETILNIETVDGLQGDEYFNALVETHNVADGDQNLFIVNDSDLFTVAKVANGTQGIRRQRLSGETSVTIPTSMRMIRIYAELDALLSGRIDFNQLIQRVSNSFRQEILNEVSNLWEGVTSKDIGGDKYFPAAGNYDEDVLLDLIAHVEANAGGKTATIIGTKKALRNLAPAIECDSAANDLYNMGYYGRFYGSPVVMTPQRHKNGTTDFVFDDNTLTIVAGDSKPIKFVYEGDPLIITRNPEDNADLTQEYLYGQKYGLGLVVASGSGIGKYSITTD